MTDERKKLAVFFVAGFLCCFALFTASWAVFESVRERADQKRMSEYADRNKAAEELTDSAERRLDELAEQMHTAGEAVAECSTDVAELRIYSDRITGANEGIEGSAERIEESVFRIMRILEPG